MTDETTSAEAVEAEVGDTAAEEETLPRVNGLPQAYAVPESLNNALRFVQEFAESKGGRNVDEATAHSASKELIEEIFGSANEPEAVLQHAVNESYAKFEEIGVAATLTVVTQDPGELLRLLAAFYTKGLVIGAAAAQGRTPTRELTARLDA